jgi:hypothetical protein
MGGREIAQSFSGPHDPWKMDCRFRISVGSEGNGFFAGRVSSPLIPRVCPAFDLAAAVRYFPYRSASSGIRKQPFHRNFMVAAENLFI